MFAVTLIDEGEAERFGFATAGAIVATPLLVVRFDRFGLYFADQVWRDCAAGRPEESSTGSATG